VKLIFAKSVWEAYGEPLDLLADRIAGEGYGGIEVYIRDRPEGAAAAGRIARERNLALIAQIATRGETPDDHIRNLRTDYVQALDASPLFVNSHTGRDWFGYDDNLRIFAAAEDLAAVHGIPIRHETHRGRAFFSLPHTVSFLRALPSLRITADLSHWFCVHEEGLESQQAALADALSRARHIHARVGFAQGPQVSDPRNPAYRPWVDRSVALWREILRLAREAGEETFTLTPEFGPPEYMPLRGIAPEPCGDAWEINGWMHRFLAGELGEG